VKATFPVEAPPIQVELNVPVGQTARAARTHPSHRPLLTLIVAPASVTFNSNSAVPDELVVDVGAPPHLVMAPAAFMVSTFTYDKRQKALSRNHPMRYTVRHGF
jgi:hypothetical protein